MLLVMSDLHYKASQAGDAELTFVWTHSYLDTGTFSHVTLKADWVTEAGSCEALLMLQVELPKGPMM